MALVNCVVPIITALILLADIDALLRSALRLSIIPLATSEVVSDLLVANIVSLSSSTASVCVPPTSIPMRIKVPLNS